MPDTPALLAFIAAGLLLNLTPGPDVFYIVNHALRSGVRAGLVAALGITAGCCVHIAAAATSALTPMAAAAMCTQQPAVMPKAATSPARTPLRSAWLTM